MFFFLASFCLSEYVELTSANVAAHIGGPKPIFVKFYSPSCGHCSAMAEDFANAANTFADVNFGGVDCAASSEICIAHNATAYPTLLLFVAESKSGIEYKGTRSVDGFCDFVENYTDFKAKRPPRVLADVHPFSIHRHITENKCLLNIFYAPWCGHSKRFLPQARLAALAFQPELNITLGLTNCDQYHELCEEYDVKGYPTIKLFKNGIVQPYAGGRLAEGVVDFVNKQCGTERSVSGLLNDRAGLVNNTEIIVNEFMQSEDKQAVITRTKAVEGAEFYVTVMERYMKGGIGQLEKDVAIMSGLLDERKGSWTALDGMKKRLNVFRAFVRKPPASAPEPPASAAEPPASAAEAPVKTDL
jgi:protein disulfide-isomerase A6